jgi:hypothetical protein
VHTRLPSMPAAAICKSIDYTGSIPLQSASRPINWLFSVLVAAGGPAIAILLRITNTGLAAVPRWWSGLYLLPGTWYVVSGINTQDKTEPPHTPTPRTYSRFPCLGACAAVPIYAALARPSAAQAQPLVVGRCRCGRRQARC